MENNQIFSAALTEVRAAKAKKPEFTSLWKSLLDQLEFLTRHETFSRQDLETLEKICIGHIAIKNIEDWDEALARLLLQVQVQVDALCNELSCDR